MLSFEIFVTKTYIKWNILFISQTLVLVYIIFIKYSSYLWYLQSYAESQISLDMQYTIFITELVLGAIACFTIVYTYRLLYK